MVKRRFRRRTEWPFVDVPMARGGGWRRRWNESRADNDDIFLTWLVHKLRLVAGRNLADGERFNALAFSMSQANLDVLVHHISAGLYLQFCPRLDATLKDGEMGVDTDAVIIKEKR